MYILAGLIGNAVNSNDLVVDMVLKFDGVL